jgi:hypothetical protein
MPFFVLGFVSLSAEIVKMISQLPKILCLFVIVRKGKCMATPPVLSKFVIELMKLVAEIVL